MPMIQIEQDSAELIAQVRGEIADMVERMRKHPGTVVGPIAEEFVRGYLSALVRHGPLSVEQWRQLSEEAKAAADAKG